MSKAKFRKGEPIRSLDELVRQEYVYFFDKITHIGWFQNWLLGWAARYIGASRIYYAIRKDEENDEDGSHQENQGSACDGYSRR